MLLVLAAGWLAQAAPVAPPRPAPLPLPPSNWQALPRSAGTWIYRPLAGGSEAAFHSVGGVQFTLRCTLASRRVSFIRTGAAANLPLTLLTTGGTRVLPAGNAVSSYDPLLDLLAFSRGKIGVVAAPASILILPSWAEPARTIEDCRK